MHEASIDHRLLAPTEIEAYRGLMRIVDPETGKSYVAKRRAGKVRRIAKAEATRHRMRSTSQLPYTNLLCFRCARTLLQARRLHRNPLQKRCLHRRKGKIAVLYTLKHFDPLSLFSEVKPASSTKKLRGFQHTLGKAMIGTQIGS